MYLILLCIYVCMQVYIYVYTCICMYVCIGNIRKWAKALSVLRNYHWTIALAHSTFHSETWSPCLAQAILELVILLPQFSNKLGLPASATMLGTPIIYSESWQQSYRHTNINTAPKDHTTALPKPLTLNPVCTCGGGCCGCLFAWPGTRYVDGVTSNHRALSAFTSQVLRFKEYTTTFSSDPTFTFTSHSRIMRVRFLDFSWDGSHKASHQNWYGPDDLLNPETQLRQHSAAQWGWWDTYCSES